MIYTHVFTTIGIWNNDMRRKDDDTWLIGLLAIIAICVGLFLKLFKLIAIVVIVWFVWNWLQG